MSPSRFFPLTVSGAVAVVLLAADKSARLPRCVLKAWYSSCVGLNEEGLVFFILSSFFFFSLFLSLSLQPSHALDMNATTASVLHFPLIGATISMTVMMEATKKAVVREEDDDNWPRSPFFLIYCPSPCVLSLSIHKQLAIESIRI